MLSIRVVVLMLVLAMAVTTHSGPLDDLISGGKNTFCLVSVTPKIVHCNDEYKEEITSRSGEDKEKSECCAYLSMRKCIMNVAEKECGDAAKETTDSLTRNIVSTLSSQNCLDYGPIACITMTQIIMGGIIGAVALLLLSCLCCCCCGGRR